MSEVKVNPWLANISNEDLEFTDGVSEVVDGSGVQPEEQAEAEYLESTTEAPVEEAIIDLVEKSEEVEEAETNLEIAVETYNSLLNLQSCLGSGSNVPAALVTMSIENIVTRIPGLTTDVLGMPSLEAYDSEMGYITASQESVGQKLKDFGKMIIKFIEEMVNKIASFLTQLLDGAERTKKKLEQVMELSNKAKYNKSSKEEIDLPPALDRMESGIPNLIRLTDGITKQMYDALKFIKIAEGGGDEQNVAEAYAHFFSRVCDAATAVGKNPIIGNFQIGIDPKLKVPVVLPHRSPPTASKIKLLGKNEVEKMLDECFSLMTNIDNYYSHRSERLAFYKRLKEVWVKEIDKKVEDGEFTEEEKRFSWVYPRMILACISTTERQVILTSIKSSNLIANLMVKMIKAQDGSTEGDK